MYEILFANQFKRSYKKCLKRGCDKALFEEVVTLLAETGTLPQRYKAHKLTGQWKGFWECHIQPDWLLIWEQRETELVLILTDTGLTLICSNYLFGPFSHTDSFSCQRASQRATCKFTCDFSVSAASEDVNQRDSHANLDAITL